METRKIATACFIGGFICAAVAVAVNPMFWWMGMLAGFASGYLAYEFRETLQVVPVAWQNAKKGGNVFWQKFQKALVWFFKPHPFWHSLVLIYCFSLWLLFPIFSRTVFESKGIIEGLIVLICLSVMSSAFLFFILSALIISGAEQEGHKVDFFALEEHYYKGKMEALTYRQALDWMIKGVAELMAELIATVLYFCFWQIWVGAVWAIWQMVCFFCRFSKNFFILIHSQKRLLCGIDGTIGGVIAYIWLASSSTGIRENTLLCIFGGLIGAGFGIINYEIVSKRILRLATDST